MQLEEFENKAREFIKGVFLELKMRNIIFPVNWWVDHLCWRVGSEIEYEEYKSIFSGFGERLIESVVNGRLIATFRLYNPLSVCGHSIDIVELPSIKKGSLVYKTGFEHLEFVVDRPLNQIKEMWPSEKFKTGGLSKAFNSELGLEFRSNQNIKFHYQSLKSVINLEKNKFVFNKITQLNILDKLAKYSPFVAGTFPLNIGTTTSEVDILISNSDLGEVEHFIKLHFSHWEKFKIKIDEQFVACQFSVNGLAFEIYGETRSTFAQRGFKHFQVEERLLQLGGLPFYHKIRQTRVGGLKTEAAFCKVLGVPGDPFVELEKFHVLSQGELIELLRRV